MSELSTGERIRLHRDALGLTQEEAAGLAGVSVSLWRKWEQGSRSVARFSQLIDIAQALRVEDLRALTGQPFRLGPGDRPRHDAVEDVRGALLRHPALLGVAEIVSTEALADRVERTWEIAQAASPWRYARVGQALPALIEDVEASRRAGVDPRLVARLTVLVYLLARAWTKWVGEAELALIAAERGLAAAGQVDDPPLLAAAAWNYAQALSTLGRPEQVAATVDDALALIAGHVARPDAPPELLSAAGALNLIGMVGAVRLGERASAQRLLRHAGRLATRIGDDRNDWRTAFGPTNVAIHRVSYAVELGQSRTAVTTATRVAAERAPSVERRVSHLLDLAQAHVLLREDAAALGALTQAQGESPEQLAFSVTARESVRLMLRRETASTRPRLRPLARTLGVA